MTLIKKINKEYILFGLIFSLLAIPLVYFGIVDNYGLYILPSIAALLVLYLVFKKPEVWIYTSLGLFILYTSSRGAEASADDYIFAFYYIFGILFWMGHHILFKKEKIVQNYGDMFILLFALGVILNFYAAHASGVTPMKWIREAANMFLYLFYFPIRYYFSTEKKLKPMMIFFALVLVAVSLIHISRYYFALGDMEYAYQLASADKINQTIFTVAIVFGFTFTFYQKKKINEFLLLAFIGVVTIALILTFSRTFWVIILLMTVLLFLYLPMKKKFSMLKVWLVLISLAVASFFIILGDRTEMIYTLIEKRFTSVGSGTKDESMRSRYNEWEYALKEVERYPMSGKGFASQVHFLNILTGTTYHTPTIHNGFIYFAYRAGIPMALIFLSFFLYYTLKAFFLSISRAEPLFKALSIACFLGFLSVWIANTTSAQFVYRDGFFTIFLLVAFTSIAEYNIKNNPQNIKNESLELSK